MEITRFQFLEEIVGAKQFKLRVSFDNDIEALFKPKRVTRQQEALPNQMYFVNYDRHTSEIAAFHLDRLVDLNYFKIDLDIPLKHFTFQ